MPERHGSGLDKPWYESMQTTPDMSRVLSQMTYKPTQDLILRLHRSRSASHDAERRDRARARRKLLADVKVNGKMLCYAPPELRKDREIVLAAVEQDGTALTYAAPGMRADREIVSVAIKNGFPFKQVGCQLSGNDDFPPDREITLQAVKKNGLALRWVHPSLKTDREVRAAAVRQNPVALKHTA